MSIAVQCAKCGKRYKIDDKFAGKKGKCKNCGEVFSIPEAPEKSAPTAAEELDLSTLAAVEKTGIVEEVTSLRAIPLPAPLPLPAGAPGPRPTLEQSARVKAAVTYRGETGREQTVVSICWLAILFQVGVIVYGGIRTVYDLPIKGNDAITLGAKLIAIQVGMFFGVVTPLMVLGTWGASKLMRFPLPSFAWLRMCGICGLFTISGFVCNKIFLSSTQPTNATAALQQAGNALLSMLIAVALTFVASWLLLELKLLETLVSFIFSSIATVLGSLVMGMILVHVLTTIEFRSSEPDKPIVIHPHSVDSAPTIQQPEPTQPPPQVTNIQPGDPSGSLIDLTKPPTIVVPQPGIPADPSASIIVTPLPPEELERPAHHSAAHQSPDAAQEEKSHGFLKADHFAAGPTTVPAMVTVIRDGKNDLLRRWDTNTGAKTGEIAASNGSSLDIPIVSPDAATVVRLVGSFKRSVEIYSFETSALVKSLDVGGSDVRLVGFAGPGKFAVQGRADGKNLLVLMDAKNGAVIRQLNIPNTQETFAVTRDGKLIATTTNDNGPSRIEIYDMTGGPTRRISFPDEHMPLSAPKLAFSSDGSELGVLLDDRSTPKLAIVRVPDAKMIHYWDQPGLQEMNKGPGYDDASLEYLPGIKAVLLYGRYFLATDTGRRLGNIGGAGVNRREAFNEHFLVGADGLLEKDLSGGIRAWRLKMDDIHARAESAAKSGAVKTLAPPLASAPWDARIDPIAPPVAVAWEIPREDNSIPALGDAMPVNLDAYAVRKVLFAGPGSGQALFCIGGDLEQDDSAEAAVDPTLLSVARVELGSGKILQTLSLPSLCKPIDISPDGEIALTMSPVDSAQKRDLRLDFWTLSNGKQIGFMPYMQAAGKSQDIRWAGLVDSTHVLTLNENLLICWSIPQHKALWAWKNVIGIPIFSPGRTFVVAHAGDAMRCIETAKGTDRGDLELPGPNFVPTGGHFSADGSKLIALGDSNLIVWNMETGRINQQMFSPGGKSVEFGGEGYALVEDKLVDLNKKAVVFSYRLDGVDAFGGPDGRHWYVVPTETGGQSMFCAATLPTAQNMDRLARYNAHVPLIRPGVCISIQTDADNSGAEIAARATKSLEAEGFTTTGTPVATLKIKVKRADDGSKVRLIVFNRQQPAGGWPEVPVESYLCHFQLEDPSGKVLETRPESKLTSYSLGLLQKDEDVVAAYHKSITETLTGWAGSIGVPKYVSNDGTRPITPEAYLDIPGHLAATRPITAPD